MFYNPKGGPLLTIVLVSTPGDTTLLRRLDNLFSIKVPGLDIVLVESESPVPGELSNYWHLEPIIRREKLKWKDERDLYKQAVSLCRGEYFHLSLPGCFLDNSFFEKAVEHLQSNETCNLVYCHPEKAEIGRPEISSQNYLQLTRAAINLYLKNDHYCELDGIIRASHINVNDKLFEATSWKKSLIFELACRGYSYYCYESKFEKTESQKTNDRHKLDWQLLQNQVRSIWTNFDQPSHKALLTLAALSHALFGEEKLSAPALRSPFASK